MARLEKCTRGARDAGAIWERMFIEALVSMRRFVQGAASPCCVQHSGWGVIGVVHGDDVTALGADAGRDSYEAAMARHVECNF